MSPAVYSRSTTQETLPWDGVAATPTPNKKAKGSPPPVPTASKSGCKRELSFETPAPRPTSKPALANPGVRVKTELELPPSSARVVPSKSAAPAAPPPISAQVPNRTCDSAAVLVVPKAHPKLPPPPPPKSSSLSPAQSKAASTPAQIATPRPLPKQGNTPVSTPPCVSRATSPERSDEAQAAWEEQVYDKVYQKTEAELQDLLARARKQPLFERYINQLERDVGGDQASSWGMTEPIDELVDFLVWEDTFQKQMDLKKVATPQNQRPAGGQPEMKEETDLQVKSTPMAVALITKAPAAAKQPAATKAPAQAAKQPTPVAPKQAPTPAQHQPSGGTPAEPVSADKVRVSDETKVGLFEMCTKKIVIYQ